MHSFHPSRGRVLFDVVLAFGMAASCAAAWLQTGASALLSASGVAGLYGLVHLFDMKRPKRIEAVEPPRVAFEPEPAEILVPVIAAEEEPAVAASAQEMEVVEAAAPRAGNGRRSGGSRKGGGRRGKEPKATRAAATEEVKAPWPIAEETNVPGLAEPAEEQLAFVPEGTGHQHIEPLFEPEPFARMPRRAFGRRGRI